MFTEIAMKFYNLTQNFFFSWVISQAKKELIDEDIAKYDG